MLVDEFLSTLQTHSHVHVHTLACMHTHTHTYTVTHNHAHTYTHTHARMHTCARAYTHTHTHTQTHTLSPSLSLTHTQTYKLCPDTHWHCPHSQSQTVKHFTETITRLLRSWYASVHIIYMAVPSWNDDMHDRASSHCCWVFGSMAGLHTERGIWGLATLDLHHEFPFIVLLLSYLQTIFRLRTGHCQLLSHLHRLKISHSDECPCGTGPQTPNHILQSCPTFDDLRRQTWPSPVEAHMKLWGLAETLRQTADFTLLTGLKI